MAKPAQLQPTAPPAAPTLTEDMLRERFLDFDDAEVYEYVKLHGANEHAQNFVVQFGPQKAEIATDLDASEIEFYIDKARSREEDPPIRWINIWNPGKQMETVSLLADRYGFSARLKMSIVMWDMMKDNRPKAPEPTHRLGRPSFSRSRRDLEQGANGAVQQPEQKEQNKMAEMLMSRTTEEDAATFHLMQSSLNYTSIDPDQAFICLGANWLHQRPKFTAKGHEKKEGSLVPPKHWSWFVLCNDNTVISFHEAATYDAVPEGESIHRWRQDELKYMRSNTLKVLKQLSKNASQKEKIAFTQLSNVRFSLRDDADNPAALGVEGSSNLFYYLFEDYSAAVDIVNSSKKTLESLRKVVLSDHQRQHDTKGIINKIYTLKRELSQLKQLFASYKTLIERLLAEFDLNGDAKGDGNRGDAKGRLSKKARDRFERLKDRIQSLMLDAIQEALGEQQSLQETWFNLTRERDSRATARLTRSATLLAKLSVLFLPVTFMTSYFSVEIPHLMDNYTPRTYWVSFAVIASVSFVALFFFGRVLELLTDGFEEMAERARRWLVERMCWPGSRAHREARRAEAEEERELEGWKI